MKPAVGSRVKSISDGCTGGLTGVVTSTMSRSRKYLDTAIVRFDNGIEMAVSIDALVPHERN